MSADPRLVEALTIVDVHRTALALVAAVDRADASAVTALLGLVDAVRLGDLVASLAQLVVSARDADPTEPLGDLLARLGEHLDGVEQTVRDRYA